MTLGRWARGRWILAGAAAVTVLAGCVSTTTTTTSIPSNADAETTRTPTGSSPDLSTASDQTDAQKRARIRLELASAYYSQGQTNTALDELKQALAADPNSAEAYNLRGLIYTTLNDDALAEESFRRALQLNARDGSAMHNYAWFLCQRRRFPEADRMFEQAVGQPQYRGVTVTLLAQGVCQSRAGRPAEAEKTLLRSYELDPGNPATAVNLADLFYRKGEYERARFYVRRVNNNPELSNAETLWLAARIENRLGNRQGANDLGSQLRSRYPRSREAAAFEQGRFNE
ncbi:type IV pilus biogenesis/stability protein PilW [Methylibium rhizosphaerae]|uniref:type IV pilus biogenesis/stability protein PilW n=1 Tax=Methylibium rhizosphaerae TaxID=2570323 RepID=UPI00112D9652|nr:type IV pilus biogenesis/stability protein PilW [Methylibium rhizosphaerae]